MTSVDRLAEIEKRHEKCSPLWGENKSYPDALEAHSDRAWLITALRDARGKALEEADRAVASGEYGESNGYVAAAINMATARIRALKENAHEAE